MIVLHTLQWLGVAVSLPLLVLLVFALVKDWKEIAPVVEHPDEAEFRRGYAIGWDEGYDYATHEAAYELAAVVSGCTMTPESDVADEEEAQT